MRDKNAATTTTTTTTTTTNVMDYSAAITQLRGHFTICNERSQLQRSEIVREQLFLISGVLNTRGIQI